MWAISVTVVRLVVKVELLWCLVSCFLKDESCEVSEGLSCNIYFSVGQLCAPHPPGQVLSPRGPEATVQQPGRPRGTSSSSTAAPSTPTPDTRLAQKSRTRCTGSCSRACVLSQQVVVLCDLARRWGESSIADKLVFVFLSLSRQKLIIPNGSCPVILNTYFCQKVVAKEDSKTTHEVHSWDTPLPRRSIILAQMFRFKSLTNNSPENQVNYHWLRGFLLCSNTAFKGFGIYRGDYLWSFPNIQQLYM